MTDRAELIRIARTWRDVPFAHQGRSRHGVDCGGLLVCVGREAGITVLDADVYSRSPDTRLVRQALLENCDEVALSAARPGDVLQLAFANEPQHVALLTDAGLLHAWAKPGKVVEHRIDATWLRRLVAAYTPRGIA